MSPESKKAIERLERVIAWGKGFDSSPEFRDKIKEWEERAAALRGGNRAVDFDTVIDVPKDVAEGDWDKK